MLLAHPPATPSSHVVITRNSLSIVGPPWLCLAGLAAVVLIIWATR